MNQEHVGLAINMECLERAMRFLQGDMPGDETLVYVAHLLDCFECRDYMETLTKVLEDRKRILEKLEPGRSF